MKTKQKYYNIDNLLSKKAMYNMLLGERSNGKSYATKYVALWESYHEKDIRTKQPKKRCEFAYLRRWRDEIKSRDVELYFSDMPITEITGGMFESVRVYRGDIYLIHEEEEKILDRKKIGSAFSLTSATHYKSLAFPKIGNIIFEEFITDSGYIANEVRSLMDIISTIARRDYVRVFLIGNTISRLCPYFEEWQLTHIKNQKQGTIELYRQFTNQYDEKTGEPIVVTIAVEYCENTGNQSKMFFGKKSEMITTGVWETDSFPHLPEKLEHYDVLYQIYYKYTSFKFMINLVRHKETKETLLYVYPATKNISKKCKRIVTDDFTTYPLATCNLTDLLRYDTVVIDMIKNKRIAFSDNLCGTEFTQIKKEKGTY